METPLVEPSVVWVRIFVIVCVVMFVGCLFHAIKVGILEYKQCRDRGDPRLARFTAAGTQVAFLGFFLLAYWTLESLAHSFAPYFVYSPLFPDGVRLGSFGASWGIISPATGACPEYVRALERSNPVFSQIPLSVLMMESSLTYAAMWTALMLNAGYRLVPLWAALFVVSLDALLDPVVAATYDCSGSLGAWGGPGLGFWHWFVPQEKLGDWFGVPLFNYAAWWTAPVILISLAMFVQYFRGRFWRQRRNRRRPAERHLMIVESAPTSPLFGLTAVMLLAGYVLVQTADTATPIPMQWLVLGLAALGTAAYVISRIHSFRTRAAPDPNLTLPPILFLLLPAVAFVIEGLFLEIAGLIVVGVVSVVVVLTCTLWPYEQAVCRFTRRLLDLDRMLRVAYFGFSSLIVLLGAFAVALERAGDELSFAIENWQIGGLMLIALAFQTFAYVSNDVIDLDVDREQPKRASDPLVRGAVSPEVALALALVQIPAAVLIAFLIGAEPVAYAVLLGGFGLMAVYNLCGKWSAMPTGWRLRLLPWNFPPLTDAIQALSWGSLVVFGALVIDPQHMSDNWLVVWTVFVFAVGFILLVNGIHGGLRDLANDTAQGCTTTARWLGARTGPDGTARSNWKIRLYAYLVHTAMFWILPLRILTTAGEPERGGIELATGQTLVVAGILGASFIASHVLLRRALLDEQPDRDRYISGQPLVMMQTPLLAFAPVMLGMTALFVLAVCFYAPLLANRNVVQRILRFTHPEIAADACRVPEAAPHGEPERPLLT